MPMRYRLRTLSGTVGLALSMFAGIVAAAVSLLYRPSWAEYSALRLVLGAIAGAVAWKAAQAYWRRVPGTSGR